MNYIYIVPIVIVLGVFVYTFLSGKSTINSSFAKNLILGSVIAILLSTLIITNYYERQLKIETEKLHELLKTSKINDSLIYNKELRQLKLDSLRDQNKKLLDILERLQKQEKVLGEKNNVKQNIRDKIKSNNSEIGEIEKYNEILNKKILDKRKGYTTSGQTSNFVFECPKNFDSEYFDLKLKFMDEKLVSKIAYIYISFSEKVSDNRYTMIFDQVYVPQNGVNGFRIKNHFIKGKEVDLDVGYILKSESTKEYPEMERVVCRNY